MSTKTTLSVMHDVDGSLKFKGCISADDLHSVMSKLDEIDLTHVEQVMMPQTQMFEKLDAISTLFKRIGELK